MVAKNYQVSFGSRNNNFLVSTFGIWRGDASEAKHPSGQVRLSQ